MKIADKDDIDFVSQVMQKDIDANAKGTIPLN
jgi:hypothetical protein